MKRFLSIIIALSLLIGLLFFDVSAADEVASGTCGDNLTWKIEERRLYISGTGDMYDYSPTNLAPWFKSNVPFSSIEVKNGVTGIGTYAFRYNKSDGAKYAHGTVIVAATVKEIRSHAFAYPDGTLTGGNYIFFGPAPEIAEDAFTGRKTDVYTLQQWDEADMQGYGGTTWWELLALEIHPDTQKLYELDEQIEPADLRFRARVTSHYSTTYDFEPVELEIAPHDNSTYGQKTVELKVDGLPIDLGYFVTDGQNHLDLVKVKLGSIPVYSPRGAWIKVTVTAGEITLVRDTDYELTYANTKQSGLDASVTVKGLGIYAGFERTFTYPILRRNIADAEVGSREVAFTGSFVKPSVWVDYDAVPLYGNEDYLALPENNINIGTVPVRVIGIGNFYGVTKGEYEITPYVSRPELQGNYLGNAEGELSDDIPYYEMIMAPTKFEGSIYSYQKHIAVYALYRLEGDAFVLIHEEQAQSGNHGKSYFKYDFSDVYQSPYSDGGDIFMLAYSWVTTDGSVYGGVMMIGVPAKVGLATAMELTKVEDEDFRMEFLTANGTDGVLENVIWKSSNNSVATVENGNVSFKQPGTVTVTAQSGNLSASKQLTMTALDITEGLLYSYSAGKGAQVIYDCRLLEEGTDYTLSVEQKDGQNIVTVTGCGLFKGQLVRSFDAQTGEGGDHTHTYASTCETVCTGCQETRPGGHNYSNDWSKNTTHHWHECGVCGDQTHKAEHTLASGDSSTCTVCGKLYLPGDFDGDWLVTESDVIWLLWHTVDPTSYPLVSSGDYDGDGNITESDVIHLLWHTVDPDNYPLN